MTVTIRRVLLAFLGGAFFGSGCTERGPSDQYALLHGVWEGSGTGTSCLIAGSECINYPEIYYLLFEDSSVMTEWDGGLVSRPLKLLGPGTPRRFRIDSLPGILWGEMSVSGYYEVNGESLRVFGVWMDEDSLNRDTSSAMFTRVGSTAAGRPADSAYVAGVASWNYWQALKAVVERRQSLSSAALGFSPTPDQVQRAVPAMADEIQRLRRSLGRLAVHHVDPRVISHAAERLRIMGKEEALLRALAPVHIQNGWNLPVFDSASVTLSPELLIRAMGAPPDPVDLPSWLDQRARLQAQLEHLLAEQSEMDSREIILRATLSETYGRAFGPLSR